MKTKDALFTFITLKLFQESGQKSNIIKDAPIAIIT